MSFSRKLEAKGILCLDGAMASELERRGCNLNQNLWSAAVLAHRPAAILDVHRAYLEAGADCISSASYQASLPGFVAAGYSPRESEALYRLSIRLAFEARDAFCRAQGIGVETLDAPLVAISMGPYGAYLADGSEYHGHYDASAESVQAFHRERIELAVDALRQHTDQPLLAIETLPSLAEAKLLAGLLDAQPALRAWISFACGSASSTAEGQPIADCVQALNSVAGLVALGVNCTRPAWISELVQAFSSAHVPVIAYPNSGEEYDPTLKRWSASKPMRALEAPFGDWAAAGACILGGCCRTTPEWIADLVRWRAAR